MAHTDPAVTTITFWGASETVTGSRFLVEGHGRRILVDCGLFQGVKRLREMNWQRFPVDPSSIDAVVVTHAHIDHYGGLDRVRTRTAAPVAIHAYDRRVIEHHRERHVAISRGLRRFFKLAGLEGDRLERALALYHGTRVPFVGGPVATPLHDGMLLDDRFTVLHVPGHCPGQVCVRLGDLLFTADHVLPATFPHLAPESVTPWTGLQHYLDALGKVAALEGVRLALPGHGQPMADLGGRIAQLRRSSDRKLARVREACAEPRTIAEITAFVYPKVGEYEGLLALEKVGAYVEHLDQLGELAVANLDEVAADEGCAPRYVVATPG